MYRYTRTAPFNSDRSRLLTNKEDKDMDILHIILPFRILLGFIWCQIKSTIFNWIKMKMEVHEPCQPPSVTEFKQSYMRAWPPVCPDGPDNKVFIPPQKINKNEPCQPPSDTEFKQSYMRAWPPVCPDGPDNKVFIPPQKINKNEPCQLPSDTEFKQSYMRAWPPVCPDGPDNKVFIPPQKNK